MKQWQVTQNKATTQESSSFVCVRCSRTQIHTQRLSSDSGESCVTEETRKNEQRRREQCEKAEELLGDFYGPRYEVDGGEWTVESANSKTSV